MQRIASVGAVGALLLLALPAGAQLTQPGRPASDWADLASRVPTTVMPAIDVEALLAEDAQRGPFPLKYGEVIETDVGIDSAGVWEEVPADGSLVWRARIAAPGAFSLGIVFTEYDIPAGGQVFLYADGKPAVYGAYTDANNNVNGLLGIEPVFSDAVTIEYVQQAFVTEMPHLRVGQVIHDYKDLRNLLQVSGSGGGDSGAGDGGCGLIGINCPEGAPYQIVKRAVMRTLAGGALCSAALLNNTASDGIPYMLTANHCGSMTAGQFLFNYEQLTCGTSSGSQSQTVSGAVKLVATSTYDSQLYKLNTNPPAAFQPFYAGWSRSTTTGSPATTIGHGNGGPKNMAIDNNGASISGVQWQVFWNQGYIVGGNSGGPLFNGSKRVIGPACCVSTFTCGSQTAWFGRFDQFYTAFNLGQWLDPLGTGTLNLDGFDPFATVPVLTGITPGSVEAFQGGLVTLTGTGLLGASTVHVGAVDLTQPGFTIVDDGHITFGSPQPTALGTVAVTVEKPTGTSNPVNLTYVPTDPPAQSVTPLTVTGLTVIWSWGAQPNDLWFLFVKANSSATVPFMGYDLLVSPFFITSGTLNAVGIGNFSTLVPPGLSGGTIYSQAILIDDATFGFAGATPVGSTQILL
jgi:hypothetical protein